MTSEFRYLFIYGNLKKKVMMEMEGGGASKEVLVAKAQGISGRDDVTVQTWDKDFEEWVDLDDDELVESNTKVLITSAESELDSSVPSSVSSCAPSSNGDDPASTAVDPPCTPGPSTLPPTSTMSPSTSTTMPSSSRPVNHPRPYASPVACSSSNWHLPYQLPGLPSALETKIKSGKLLKEPERSAILEAICSSVKVHTYYPKTGQYDFIIKLLLEKFPTLTKLEDLSYADSLSLWKSRLQTKFQNMRKREDKDIPVVKARKRKATTTAQTMAPQKKAVPQWGMVNYLPSRNASEDDASVQLHIEWMQQESRKKKPNHQRVEESLVATLADRRRWIVLKGALASEVKELYPWIFKEDELLNEFQRIHGSRSITSLLDEGLAKYAGAIVALGKTAKCKSALFKEAVEHMASLSDNSARKEALHQAAVLGVPTLLDEPVEHMVCQDGMETSVVYMKMDDEYEVIVEKVTVATTEKFNTAFANYLSSFYCLNLQYQDTLMKTLEFFQRVVLGINDNTPKGKPVTNLQARLGRYLSAHKDD